MPSLLDKSELLHLLRLLKTPNIGAVNAKKLLKKFGKPSAIFKEKKEALLRIDGIGERIISNLWDKETMELAQNEVLSINKNAVSYTYFEDDNYPRRLKHCIDAPLLLFTRGSMNLNEQRIISVVGTRKITSYGQAFCNRFISELAPLNPTIVSGFAYGVDIAAQKAAMANDLQTIGCLAHGLNHFYPRAHEKYASQVEKNGGFVTEFWHNDQPERENFLKRNRIIAGMSEATIVIESAEKGGSLVTAEIADSYNRDVFAVPGRALDKYSVGCNNLIKKQKAHILTSAADLVYMLGWDVDSPEKEKTIQKKLFVELHGSEKILYDYLHANGKQLLDIIALECKLPVFNVSSLLLNMEMKGLVRPLPGKLFEAI